MALKPKESKPEMRLTFTLDPATTYKLKAKAKAEKLPFPAYLRACVLRDAGLTR